MPAPYSNLYQAFFRQGVTKTFTQGYAQSVVAATHPHVLNPQNRPSFARRNSNRFSRVHALQLQSAFHTERTVSAGLSDHRHDRSLSHGGLDAYYEALQKQHAAGGEEVDKEWTQFQFPKQIEWKPTPASIVGETEARTPGLDLAAHDGETSHTISTADEAALAHIDAALRDEIEARKSLDPLEEEDASVLSVRAASPLGSEVARSRVSCSLSERSHTPASIARSVSPVDPQSQRYADHLLKLAQNGRHAEVPAVFEAMLVAGVAPTSQAYNALLSAAIHVPTEKTEIVSKALDVYADMVRRKIQPDSETYSILVSLLASRSVEVKAAKRALETLRIRFGGMDEPGKFMLASSELEYAILSENDRLDLAVRLFDDSVAGQKAAFDAETYHMLITACAESLRVPDMIRLFEHMEKSQRTPYAATFAAMIAAFAKTGNLVSAVECYNEYRALAIANDIGQATLDRRNDTDVYSAVIHAYIISDKVEGASKFFKKIVAEYGVSAASITDALIRGGFVQAFTERGIFQEALQWAQAMENESRAHAMRDVAIQAADNGDKATAITAFGNIPFNFVDIATPAVALMAMSVRSGDVASATKYWRLVSNADVDAGTNMIEPTVMYAIALIGTGEVAEGLAESDRMFRRIQSAGTGLRPLRADEIEEGVELISRFMKARGIVDPRQMASQAPSHVQTTATPAYSVTQVASGFRDSFDPYAHSTDFKGSSIIADELEDGHGRKARGLGEALARFRNMRRAGRHPRYVTYAKLISAAAREGKTDLCHEILAMARKDVPLLAQYPVVHWGWSCILDAMVGASLTTGNRDMAEQFHRELIGMGSAPSANTYGLYITTLKESTKTFDEASEAVKIFHRAKAEGVEPSSFLYNALIGKLGKARRIDDCLFYFAEMRALGIKPTSVTYGTIVNALCRVSDEKFAEELFDEMEAMPNYKARPAPYNSMMQFFLTTKRDKAKVIAYYNRMMAKGIAPTAHTYKLLIDTHATLEPVDMAGAEHVLADMKAAGQRPEAVHYASLIHARGCVLHDVNGARSLFDTVLKDRLVPANACLFQALFEAMVANHHVAATEPVLGEMRRRGVEITPYIANTLIHGWAAEKNIDRARDIYGAVGHERREPSTYEAMTRAYLAVEQRDQAKEVVDEMLGRGYPVAVVNKVLELVGGGATAEA